MNRMNKRTRSTARNSSENAFFRAGGPMGMPATSFTLRPSGENAFFGMGAATDLPAALSNTVLPATVFTSSPNTPTVSNPAESALAKAAADLDVDTRKNNSWLTLVLSGLIGALVAYYIVTKLAK